MPDRVSPGRTTQVTGASAATGAALSVSTLAGATAGSAWVLLLLAMLVFAWAA